MNDEIITRLMDTLPDSIRRRAGVTFESLMSPIKDLLNRRQFPATGFTDLQVEWLLRILSSMDSDKDPEAARVGEREGRIASNLIGELSAGFNHGIGRSGHITAPQPKAPGASLMQRLANQIALDAIRKLGLPNVRDGLILPMSTGMTISLTLSYLRMKYGVRRVLYPRIDHTSPTRGIAMAGLEEVIIKTKIDGDAVRCDLDSLEKVVSQETKCAILATTTFFAPRESDPIKAIARVCQERDIPMVINNAYGVQSESIMEAVRSAVDAGRVDAVVQSNDKNFLTPVGGTVVVSPDEACIEGIAETYAGRASAAPVVQTLAALLVLGHDGYRELMEEQKINRRLLESRLSEMADELGQRVLRVENPISCAMTLDGIDANELGARLYTRRVTGPRAVERGARGSSVDNYPHSYIVMNAAIGARRKDVEGATAKLYKELGKIS